MSSDEHHELVATKPRQRVGTAFAIAAAMGCTVSSCRTTLASRSEKDAKSSGRHGVSQAVVDVLEAVEVR
jgi:hypothetical protein